MTREQLFKEVKAEYARIAEMASRDNFIDHANADINGEAYFEALLSDVLHGIEKGKFDDCNSGEEVVQAVANDKSRLYR